MKGVLYVALLSLVCWWPGQGYTEDTIRPRPMNFSSHGPEFLTDLLSGRVWLFERRGRLAGLYFHSDGAASGCWRKRRSENYYVTDKSWRWEVGIRIGGANLELMRVVKGQQVPYAMVLIYDGASGDLRGERFNKVKKKWFVTVDGWLEEGWPRALKERCGALSLPEEVVVNRQHESLLWSEAVRARKAVMAHRGWKNAFPGARGLGRSQGKATISLSELKTVVAGMNGTVVRDINGEDRVVLTRELDGELWELRENGEIGETADLVLVRDGTVIAARWRPSGRVTSYYVGYPFPLRPTGKRFAAFRMIDDLIVGKIPVHVRLTGSRSATIQFRKAGKLIGAGAMGSWELTHGLVVLRVHGSEKRYEWREFAELAGWLDLER